jgi:hypothetical protein
MEAALDGFQGCATSRNLQKTQYVIGTQGGGTVHLALSWGRTGDAPIKISSEL